MTTIEVIVIIIFSIISLPYLCKSVSRPSLLYSSYLLVGMAIGPVLGQGTHFMIEELGNVGFILLLFLIGLEIEIPAFSIIKKSIPFCMAWLLIQAPLLVFGSWGFGLGWGFGFLVAGGVNACSVSIAYNLLKGQEKRIDQGTSKIILIEMVLLEIISLFFLAASEAVYEYGWSQSVLWQGVALLSFILIIRIFSGYIHLHFSNIIESSGKWKIHQLLLTIFIIAIMGDKLGLSPAKTAFFLGLFMTSITNNGRIRFEDELKPLAKRVLIPIFFISLGSRIDLSTLLSWILPASISISVLLLAIRYLLFSKLSRHNIPPKNFLLYCPNLTMVAVAAEFLMKAEAPKDQVDLLLITGLIMTLGPSFAFSTPKEEMDLALNRPLA